MNFPTVMIFFINCHMMYTHYAAKCRPDIGHHRGRDPRPYLLLKALAEFIEDLKMHKTQQVPITEK